MKHLLIILSILLLSSPVIGDSKKPSVFYRWEIDEKVYVWKNFGDEDINPKYTGEIKDEKPDGMGITIFPDGSKFVGLYKNGKRHGRGTWFTKISGVIKLYTKGEWKDGFFWNMNTYDFDGKVRDKYINGLLIYGVLFSFKENDTLFWTIDDEKKDGKYVGEIKNGIPNGKGLLKYNDGNELSGKWRNGFFNDNGTLTYPNGEKYLGEFKNGKWDGQGTLTFPNGRKYVGEFKDGKWNGQGTLTLPNGEKYVGGFKNGKKDGQGTLSYPNGRKYVGEFKNGKWDGQGTLTYSDGRKSTGEYRLDKPLNVVELDKNGIRITEWVDGLITFGEISYGGGKYVGEFKNGKLHGHGIYTYRGGKYVGEWKNGEKNGQGTLTYSDGRKYVGEFKNGKLQGHGIYTYRGGKYVGEWKNGEKNGQGTETLPDGRKYVGKWKNGEKNGQGTLTYPDGSESTGEYRLDEPWNVLSFNNNGTNVGEWVNGVIKFGEISFSGGIYVGELKNGKPHGQGTSNDPYGNKYVGEFKEGHYWNGTEYDKDGNINWKYVNGKFVSGVEQ